MWFIAGIAVLGATLAIGFGVFVATRVLRGRLHSRAPIDPERWKDEIAATRQEAHLQAAHLRRVNHTVLKISPRTFWELLVPVEPDIRQEPALAVYWQKRREVEQMLRQQEREGPSSPSA